MAEAYKVLGQSSPSANTDTSIYTVPSGKQVVVSSIVVCNRGSSTANLRIAIRPSGETLANKHYYAYDLAIDANAIMPLASGITLAATDIVTVRSSTSDLSFSIFGAEIT